MIDIAPYIPLTTKIFFYLVAGILALLSAFALYIFHKHSEYRGVVSTTISLVYIVVFLIISFGINQAIASF